MGLGLNFKDNFESNLNFISERYLKPQSKKEIAKEKKLRPYFLLIVNRSKILLMPYGKVPYMGYG